LILVFGAGGQLGQELTAKAASARVPLAGVSHADADIAEPDAVSAAIDRSRPAIVVNAAAYNAVDRAESEPDAAMRVNAHGPGTLAAACDRRGLPMIHISTDYVFDGYKTGAYDEHDAVHPLSAYARSKAAGEEAVRQRSSRHLIVRTAWLYGCYGSNFVKTMLKLGAQRPSLDIVFDQRGSPTSTADLADALLVAAKAAAANAAPWGTYHFAGTGSATRYEFVERIMQAQKPFTGHAPTLRPVASADYPAAAHRPLNSALDSEKFAAAFGVRSAAWQDAVDRTVAALLAPKGKA
jgi:dTDP-4-dehydrorhamnose reductase